MTTREVVESIIKPDTAGKGAGYALLKNLDRPLRATVMVSHAWDAKYTDLVSALAVSGEPGPFWVCATALYQPEDTPELTLERQLGSEAGGPLTVVLGQVAILLCVLTAACNMYSRLWCLFEIFTAVQLGVEVRVTSRQSGRYGLGALEDLLLKLCEEPIDSCEAQCGMSKGSGAVDRAAIRNAIDASPGGHRAVDVVVEESRLAALIRGRDRLTGGGWKDTTIGREYQDAINIVRVRLGKAAAASPRAAPAVTPPGSSRPKRLNKTMSEASLVTTDRSPAQTPSAGQLATATRAAAPPPSMSRQSGASSPYPASAGSAARASVGGSCGSLRLEDQWSRMQRSQQQSTPRSNTRQHYAPIISM